MKIIHLIISSGWGGLEQYVFDLCDVMKASGHDLQIVARDYPEITSRFTAIGIPVTTAPLKKMFDYTSAHRIASLIADGRPVIIHCHSFRDAAIAIKARKFSRNRNARIVVSRHIVKPGSKSFFDNRIYRRIDAAIFVSDLAKQEFLSSSPRIGRDKLHTVHNSIRLDKTDIELPKQASDNGLKLMFHGRISPEKGIDTAIQALALINDPNITLSIVGAGDPTYTEQLKSQAKSLSVDSRVIWLGQHDNVHPLIEKADIGICPSRVRESFGLSIIEYMAHGIPVITTDNGAQPEYITSWHDGILLSPENPQAIAQAIIRLRDDTPLRLKIGMAARERFVNTLSYPCFVKKISDIYTSVLSYDCIL